MRRLGLNLITGPANAGKVALLLRRYLEVLSQEPYLIVPNRSDVEERERELLELQPALLGGWIGTFDDLFKRIAALVRTQSDAPPAPDNATDTPEPVLDGPDQQLSEDFSEALGFGRTREQPPAELALHRKHDPVRRHHTERHRCRPPQTSDVHPPHPRATLPARTPARAACSPLNGRRTRPRARTACRA